MKFYQLLVVLLLPLFAGNVFAEKLQNFDELDADGDGYITKKEGRDHTEIKTNWMKADTDNDGKIDVSEFSAFEGRNMFEPADVEEPEPGAAPTVSPMDTPTSQMK